MPGFTPKVDEQHFLHWESPSPESPLFFLSPRMFAVQFLLPVGPACRRLRKCTHTCTYPTTLPVDAHKSSPSHQEKHTPAAAALLLTGAPRATCNPPFSGEHHGLQSICPPKLHLPNEKPKSLCTIRVQPPSSEGSRGREEAAQVNYREEAKVRVEALFFFLFFYYKKEKDKTIWKKSKCRGTELAPPKIPKCKTLQPLQTSLHPAA